MIHHHSRHAAAVAVSLLVAALLLGGCFLKGRSPLHSVHRGAEVLVEGATEAAFSPDGRFLAYVRMDGGKSWTADIYVRDLGSGSERRLTQGSDYDGQPTWAPDSRLLAYTSRRRGRFNLFLASLDGGERQLTWAGGRQAHFSPDGVSIVYAGDEMGSADLFLTTPTGGIARRLTQDPGREWFPRYSPDGRYIAFVSDAAGSDDLWLLERASGRRTQLTSLPGAEVHPAWSPDSRSIVFASNGGNPQSQDRLDLYAVEIVEGRAAGAPVPLTGCGGLMCQSTHPSISPDGRLLVFTSAFNPIQVRLARVRLGDGLLAMHAGR
jgi:Tol biopolymer transport system component